MDSGTDPRTESALDRRVEGEIDTVEVRRNTRLATAVAVAALLTAVAFWLRGGAAGLVVGVVMLVIAGFHAWTAYDGRTPLMLLDEQGVRIRFGRAWRGIPWSGVEEVEHLPRPRPWWQSWRDGRLAVLLTDEEEAVAELPSRAQRHARLTQRLYGVPFAVPLGIGTRVLGARGDLTGAVAELAGESVPVVEIDPTLAAAELATEPDTEPDTDAEAAAEPHGPDAEPGESPLVEDETPLPTQPYAVVARAEADAAGPTPDATTQPARQSTVPQVERPVAASPTPSPLREPTVAVRTDLRWQPEEQPALHGANALRLDPSERETDGDAAEATELIAVLPEGVTPIAKPGEPVPPLEFDDLEAESVPDPVIGPELAAARTRLGLSVETLAERTRIRPHVIESIEVDDFGPCGGDFYARGHLRTLARVLGVDVAPLLASYDERYADGPVDPRTVFEAELASGPTSTLRRMRGGPNWSVLVAAVMAVVLVWSVARLVMDGSHHPQSNAISLDSGSAGTRNPYGKTAAPVPVTLTAVGGGAHVVVRDANGQVVFTGDLAFSESRTLKASPPLRVQTSDGSLRVSVAGGPTKALGKTGEPAQKTYTVN
ncbi:helix-turn-helix domain-containing protein [Nocardioides sp. DS6]|uniref:Helix-turn-helix domain-containing protein n=1 Tax=Nocardioides eburneus TaxID=3231482 RepID=A0ABV3SVR8_9ACTN